MSQPGATLTSAHVNRILVAEDDEAIRLYLELVLVAEGYRVVLAPDGEEAVRKYQEQGPFDLAILDVHMPRLGGPEALARIRQVYPGARSLIMSGTVPDARPGVPEWAKGFDGYLAKPFNPPDLLAVVQRLLALPAN